MCGIVGWVDFERDLVHEGAVLQKMTDSQAPRGPDDAGVWLGAAAALGHRRLAVIDPAGGAQPMVHGDGDRAVVLVYSGEVYNYRELRATLTTSGHRFRTSSDTEVVLRSYLQWGEAAVRRLRGMFAFAVWDGRRQQLLLVRDRLGIKPLFYASHQRGLLFGSEPKAIFAAGLVEPVVDAEGLCQLFGVVRAPGEAVFRGLAEVRPGHAVRFDRTELVEHRYWALEAREHEDDRDRTVAHVRGLLEDVVAEQLVADVPLCTLLSGGLDSSTVAALGQRALAQRGGGPMRTFSVDFTTPAEQFTPDAMRHSRDADFVREVVEHVGSDHRDVVLDATELTGEPARLAPLLARDLPPFGDVDTSLHLLFRAIRPHCTVALSGEGADEVFGGYAWFHDPAVVAADAFPWVAMARGAGRLSVFEPGLARFDLRAYQADRYAEALAEVPRLAGESDLERRMRELCYCNLTRFLPAPLERKDRLSMAVGLEVRVPYCDHRLVEYVFNVPWSIKAFDGREKSLLRAAARGLLPDRVAQRPKSPYPATQDLRYHQGMSAAVQALLVDRDAPVLPLLHRPMVRALAAMPPSGQPAVLTGLERVLGLNAWLERYQVRVAA